MSKIIYICGEKEEYIDYIKNAVTELLRETILVIRCKNLRDLFSGVKNCEESFVICDKPFLGFWLELRRNAIKWFISKSAKTMITAWDTVGDSFGVRVKNLEFEGFINNISNKENLMVGLSEFFKKGTYFDEIVNKEFLDKASNVYAKCISDIRIDEIECVLSSKCPDNKKILKNGKPDPAVYNKISNFRKKNGISSGLEFDELVLKILYGEIW